MGYNLVPGVSGIIYGVSGGYNQLVLRVSDNSSTYFSVVFGHFPLFSGNSDVFIRLPLVSSLGCKSVPGVVLHFLWGCRGLFFNIFNWCFRVFPVVCGDFGGVHVAYRGVFYGLQLCPGGFMHFGFGLPGVPGNS